MDYSEFKALQALLFFGLPVIWCVWQLIALRRSSFDDDTPEQEETVSSTPGKIDLARRRAHGFFLLRGVIIERRPPQCNELPNTPDDGQTEEKERLQGFEFAVIHNRRLEGLKSNSIAGGSPFTPCSVLGGTFGNN